MRMIDLEEPHVELDIPAIVLRLHRLLLPTDEEQGEAEEAAARIGILRHDGRYPDFIAGFKAALRRNANAQASRDVDTLMAEVGWWKDRHLALQRSLGDVTERLGRLQRGDRPERKHRI